MLRTYLFIILSSIKYCIKLKKYNKIYSANKEYTMIRMLDYADNLELCEQVTADGDVVECGVWRGGMIAGIAALMRGNRTYYLFDSYEGLPVVTEKDGQEAKEWQANVSSASYFDNCKAEMHFADAAMKNAGCTNYSLEKGWFNKTLPSFTKSNKIAILRLDGDWYDSTMCCLNYLYPKVVSGGLIIIDDYYTWEGCTKAVHDYLSKENLSVKIEKTKNGVCYIRK